ncbi:hypothetical protein BGZ80_007936 [Entomortierella chlamydospora]|uniref:C2h2 transcription factor n=1 Tax=Entomortierella chlamydospora TaxID=101097 RepID=A0A9P6MXQ5_9FUNG|nr:hypothetical protein BGZ80_007936 [Entomortierella chlamydospora]
MASKPKGAKDITNVGNNGSNSTISNNSTPAATPTRTNSTAGQRGPIGPRPGVYRPCARCRVKKTKCDRLKPSCSSCTKGGADVICVYDNDEPTSVSDIGSSASNNGTAGATLSSVPSSPSSKKESFSDSTKRTANYDGLSKTKSTSGHGTRSGSGSGTTISTKMEETTSLQTSTDSRKVGSEDPPHKRLKTGPSEAVTPNPLRSSVTTTRIPTSKSSTSTANNSNLKLSTKSLRPANDDAVDIESMDEIEDKEVLGLSIANAVTDRLQSEVIQDEVSDAMESPAIKRTSSSSTGPIARQRKQPKATSATGSNGTGGGGNNSRIMADLVTPKPPPFVIDKSQKARKWGRPSTVIQTLGGEISLPLWISDQEMLLNEPRPYFMQRSYPMPSTSASLSSTLPTSTSATATNLARMAVFNQMDNTNFAGGYDTPERGTSPDSRESSPAGGALSGAPSSPRTKKKRGPRKPHQGNLGDYDDIDPASGGASTTGVKRKRVGGHHSSSTAVSLKSSGGGDDEAGDSSARSTPAPTPRPRAVPTRPRQYPCSFEGCTKSFMDKFHLKRHETRHVTQVIICGIDGCTKAYDSISTMRRHQSMIHKERKEEIAAAERAASAAAGVSRASDSRVGKNSGDGDGDDGQSDISESPAPSSAAYNTAVSSPARD